MDLWLQDSPDNLECLARALDAYGVPSLAVNHLTAASPLEVVWIGVPPNRVDLVKGMLGVSFDAAWPRRTVVDVDGVKVSVIGKDDLIAAKRATGRDKDLADAQALSSAPTH